MARTKPRHLAGVELEFPKHDLLSLQAVASVGPSEQIGVIKAPIFKHSAIYGRLRPNLAVGVVRDSFVFLFDVGFLPLVHLNFSL